MIGDQNGAYARCGTAKHVRVQCVAHHGDAVARDICKLGESGIEGVVIRFAIKRSICAGFSKDVVSDQTWLNCQAVFAWRDKIWIGDDQRAGGCFKRVA